MSNICTLNNNIILAYSNYNGENFILINDSIPLECQYLADTGKQLRYSNVWDITWNIDSGPFTGIPENFCLFSIGIGFNTKNLDFTVISGYSIQLLCNNCRLIDELNGGIVGPAYDRTDIIIPEKTEIENTNNKRLGTLMFDHTGGYFMPNDFLQPWSATLKYRLQFSKEISQLEFRDAVNNFFNLNIAALYPALDFQLSGNMMNNIGKYWDEDIINQRWKQQISIHKYTINLLVNK